MTDMTKFTDLPHDLIFSKILRHTRVAVQVSFILFRQWIPVPILDFNEYVGFECPDDPHNHDRFVKFLVGYLEYYRDRGDHVLDTLRFNMRMNTSEDATILGRWLEFACEKGVRALDISLHPTNEPVACSELCWLTTFANAKFLTSLKLDYVRFTSFGDKWDGTLGPDHILPSLKTLSLTGLGLEYKDLAIVLTTCPSLEHLSLTNFRSKNSAFWLKTRFVKSLKFKYCEGNELPLFIVVHGMQADIIESFTWIGVLSNKMSQCFSWITLRVAAEKSLTCLNLQDVNIVGIKKSLRFKDPLFPSLKTMSFENIGKVDEEDIFSILLSGCPSLEHVSLTTCWVKELIMNSHVSSSRLKSLEIKQCSQLRLVQIYDAKNLESFTFVTQPNPKPSFRKVILDNSFKLKNINICVDGFVKFSLNGCQPVTSHSDLTNSFHKIAPSAWINIDPVLQIDSR